jgi:pyrimidine operon attenuation protein/uracil phosphoribosyltransferase
VEGRSRNGGDRVFVSNFNCYQTQAFFVSTLSSQNSPVLNAAEIQEALQRLAGEIVHDKNNSEDLVLVGIQRGGVHLAERLSRILNEKFSRQIPVGHLDVNLYRDDLGQRAAPTVHPTSIPFDITGKAVVLVDDVLYKGRTVRAAMDALNDFGRPRCIELAVLIDRGHRELPIRADFVGKAVSTGPGDNVDVRLREDGDAEGVFLVCA